MPIDEVAQMRADAQAALDALAAEHAADDAAIAGARSRAVKLAHALSREAEDPITIGVVGEFSVGKSMLLGTLLGRPALLPVEERPTTGNITALYLRPGEPGTPTVVDGAATVHFVSATELAEFVAFMCGQLVDKAGASKFPPDVTELRGGYNPVTDGWGKLEAWCQRHLWPEGGYGSLEPREIAAELLAVRDAHLNVVNSEGFLGGQVTAAESVVNAALDLRPAEITPDKLPVHRPYPGLDLNSVGYNAAALASVFPLIRRVSYRVRVDPLVWPLDSLRGTDGSSIMILDFPGLAAGRSNTRDKFLSSHELDHVHTIITVFKSDRSETDVPRQFFTMLESHGRTPEQVRDYIIAAGNAFDLLEPPSFPDDGAVTLEGLQEESAKFRSLWVATSNLTQRRDDRIRAVSSVAAISKYGYPTDGFSPDQQARLKKLGEDVAVRQREWGRIGERLALGEPDSPWGATLAAFGEDGGIASLRKLIESHVAQHGLVNKLAALKMKRDELARALSQFEALLPAEQSSGDETAAARLRVDQVSDEFRRQIALVTESLDQFRDPLRVAHAGTGVIQAAQSRCRAEVMAWPEWATLLLRAKDGVITKTQAAGRSPEWDPFPDYADSDDGTIDTTQIFFERFCKSYDDVLSSARQSMAAAVTEWIGDRNDALAGLRAQLADPHLIELLDLGGKRLAAMGRGNPDRVRPLQALADLSWSSGALASAVKKGAVTQEAIAMSFPMPLPRYLPWHKAAPESEGDLEQKLVRHQMYMFRMRREIAAAMADGVAFRLAQDIADFHRLLLDALNKGRGLIPDPGIVRWMFPDPPKADGDEAAAADAATGSPVRSLLREWRARDAQPVL